MKRLINKPEDVVEEMIQGILLCHPGVARLDGVNVLVRSDYGAVREKQVAIISGGGSGHEPGHGGYIGQGMLSAAVPGGVFASPSVHQIVSAIRAVTGKPGCLLVVKNYTGDRVNFGLACEQARNEGLDVKIIMVGEDCALNEGGIAGRRGLAGTVFVHKVAGAAAAQGKSLAEVAEIAEAVAQNMGTMGVAMTVCTVPGQQTSDRLGPANIELGLGIHGEPGVQKLAYEPIDGLVQKILTTIAMPKDKSGSGYCECSKGEDVVLMVSNLGSTPLMELYIAARAAITFLGKEGMSVVRVVVGTFMPALDMAGVSLSVLKCSAHKDLISLLDATTDAPYWPRWSAVPRVPSQVVPKSAFEAKSSADIPYPTISSELAEHLKQVVAAAAEGVIEFEPKLTEWDTLVGDADCGLTFKRGMADVLEGIQSGYEPSKPSKLMQQIADTMCNTMGGTSGVMLEIVFRAMGAHMAKSMAEGVDISPNVWISASRAGVESMMKYGGATKGMRTMIDALMPAIEAAEKACAAEKSGKDILQEAAEAAMAGGVATKGMSAMAGRSSYVNQAYLDQCPDPGAMAIATALEHMAKAYSARSS